MAPERHTIKSISRAPDRATKGAILAKQVKHGGEENDKDWKVTSLSFLTSLKACAKRKDLYQGSRIHAGIRDSGLLEKNTYLGNMLVSMYAKCGALVRAQQVVDELPVRDVVSWNALIAGYTQQRQGKEALRCLQRMQSESLSPDAITYASILKACGITQDADMGRKIHDEILSQGLLKKDIVLGNALIDMYAKCGVLMTAQNVLFELPVRNVVTWNALIAGYAKQGQGQEALRCFLQMRREGFIPDAVTYTCILKACGITQDVDMGRKIHDEIVSQGMFKKNIVLGNALVDMYVKCGVLMKARNVLEELPVRNVVSWSTLIAGYAQQGQGEEALGCFKQMRSEGLSPNEITYACVLKACGIAQDVDMGRKLHDEIVNNGLLKKDIVLGNVLVDMYAKCGVLMKARDVFDKLPVRDVVSWNVLIAGCVQQGQGQEALCCFHQMQKEGFSSDVTTYVCILKACGITQDVCMGRKIHDNIVSQGLLKKDIVLGNALIDMYVKCGVLNKARDALVELPIRDVVSWSALIVGYAQQGEGQEALGCFHRMRSEGFFPDAITYSCILKVCGITQDAYIGKNIHDEIVSQGLLKKDIVLGNALVDMYAKCGELSKARDVLVELPVRNVVSWSTLIAGYAQHGQGLEALGCFQQMRNDGFSPDVVTWNALIEGHARQGLAEEALDWFGRMQLEGTSPDSITFVSVLNACSHFGLVDEGQLYFDIMRDKYGITPGIEHYTCMVDLFGRAKLFDDAMRIIKMMPSSGYPAVWLALLGACRKWGNVKLGRFAFERAVQLDGYNAAAYVLMSNLYAAAGMQEEARNLKSKGLALSDLGSAL